MNKKIIPYQSICLIILLGFIAFGATLKLGFVWFDHQLIEENPYITRWTINNLYHIFSSDLLNQGIYTPLGMFLLMIEFSVWGLNPFGYHFISLLLHIANAVLLYFFILKLFFNKEIAFLSSIFFVVHPIIVEQLIIIGSKSEVLVNFFMFISLLFFLRQEVIWKLFSLLAFMLSLFSKESGVIIPLVLFLVLWFKKSKPKDFIWLIPFSLLTIPYLILRNSIVNQPFLRESIVDVSRFLCLQFPEILFIYLRLLLIPLGLHSHRQVPVYGQEVWIFALLLLLLGLVLLIKRFKTGIFCLLWFILLLLPKSPALIEWRFMCEYWIYSSSPAIFLPLAFLYQRVKEANSIFWQKVVQILLMAILTTYIVIANFNIALRGDDFSIYQQALKYFSSPTIIYNMGWSYYKAGNFKKALEYFQKALKVNPKSPDYQNATALALWHQTNNSFAAIEILKGIKQTNPDDISTYLNLGLIYLTNGRYDEAKEETGSACKINPDSPEAWYQLAEIYRLTNDFEKAKDYYQRTLGINPYYHLARNNLAAIYAQKGEYQKAKENWEFILHYDSKNECAKKNLARLNTLYKSSQIGGHDTN